MNVILPTIKELHFVSSVSAMVTMAFTSGNLSLIDGRLKIVHPLVMRSGIVAYAGTAITEIVYYSCKKFGRRERESSDELFGMQYGLYLASAGAAWAIGNIIFGNLEMQSENRLMELPIQDILRLTWSAVGMITLFYSGSKRAAATATILAIIRSAIAIFEFGQKTSENLH